MKSDCARDTAHVQEKGVYGAVMVAASQQIGDHAAQTAAVEVLVAVAVYKACADAMSAPGLVELLRATLHQPASHSGAVQVRSMQTGCYVRLWAQQARQSSTVVHQAFACQRCRTARGTSV